MRLALIYFACSLVTLILLVILFRADDARRGGRVVDGVRRPFDGLVGFGARQIRALHISYGVGVIQLGFHHVVSALLVHLQHGLVRAEAYIERLYRQNRQTARRISHGKHVPNHLDAIAEHKEATALSEADRERLRSLD